MGKITPYQLTYLNFLLVIWERAFVGKFQTHSAPKEKVQKRASGGCGLALLKPFAYMGSNSYELLIQQWRKTEYNLPNSNKRMEIQHKLCYLRPLPLPYILSKQ
jgi:hypothetical protein